MTLIDNAAGLGLRRGLLPQLLAMAPGAVDFLECAPDNWIGVGGAFGADLERLVERFPLTCHGLSLSLGGSTPLDAAFIEQTRRFLVRHRVALYSEHLSYCSDDGHLYDLLPLPFTEAAVRHVAARIREAQERLERRIAVENISYYAAPYREMSEIEFVNAVLDEADCDLLLDVNNLFVNACNHGYDALDFLARLPPGRVAAYHVAGHYDEAPDLKIDTHGAGPCSEPPIVASACARPCSSGTSTIRRWANCCWKWSRSANGNATRDAVMDERLRQQQFSLARHLRDPLGNAPPPDIEERRLRVYRELFYNAIEGLLASGFPRLRGLLGEQQWHGLVREFYREERSHTPLFTRIAGVFVDYLRQRGEYRPAWQAELAHFEWSETRLYLAEPDDPPYRREGDLLDGVPLLSSLALPLGYRWPVHRLEEDVALAEAPAEPTLLLMHRDSSHRVHTARLTPLAYRLLESLARRRLSGREHLAALALEARSAPGALDAAGLELLAALRTQGVVLGTLERDWAGG